MLKLFYELMGNFNNSQQGGNIIDFTTELGKIMENPPLINTFGDYNIITFENQDENEPLIEYITTYISNHSDEVEVYSNIIDSTYISTHDFNHEYCFGLFNSEQDLLHSLLGIHDVLLNSIIILSTEYCDVYFTKKITKHKKKFYNECSMNIYISIDTIFSHINTILGLYYDKEELFSRQIDSISTTDEIKKFLHKELINLYDELEYVKNNVFNSLDNLAKFTHDSFEKKRVLEYRQDTDFNNTVIIEVDKSIGMLFDISKKINVLLTFPKTLENPHKLKIFVCKSSESFVPLFVKYFATSHD